MVHWSEGRRAGTLRAPAPSHAPVTRAQGAFPASYVRENFVRLPDAAFYLWARVPGGDDVAFTRDLYAREGVTVTGKTVEELAPKDFVKLSTKDNMQLAYNLGKRAFEDHPDCDAIYIGGGSWIAEPVAAAIATAISYIAQMAMFASMFGGGGRDDEDRPNPLAMLLMSLLAPLAASLIQMAVSRSREFEADRGAAELLGSGRSLADALERIEVLAARRPMAVAPAQAQAYIHNPLNELRGGRNAGMARLFSTHPATEERVRRLRAMTPTHA